MLTKLALLLSLLSALTGSTVAAPIDSGLLDRKQVGNDPTLVKRPAIALQPVEFLLPPRENLAARSRPLWVTEFRAVSNAN
ncbi:hypothetical protein C8J57DRAFT_1705914 [Mycena rebaudengoi]|nr:hypothetical protein C8J57DRAFT_1705914 [Mycena rebaudengoi]